MENAVGVGSGGEGDLSDDPFDLARLTTAQQSVYSTVLAETKNGRKRTHWMWFIFPQMAGLGYSVMSQHYALHSLDEARAYLHHPVLGARLRECAEAVLSIEGRSALDIFGSPDDRKLQSSMTLFARAAGSGSTFARVLDKIFRGEMDGETLRRLAENSVSDRLPNS